MAPFENLSSSADADWMRRGLSQAVAFELAGAKDLHAQTVESENGAYSARAPRVLEGYFVERNGRLEIHANVRELESGKTVQALEVQGPVSQGVIPLASQLAKKLNPAAGGFPTTNENAFRSYGKALDGRDRDSALRGFAAAAQDDPRFGLAYVDWAKVLLAGGDREGALQVIETAKHNQLDPIDGAQLDYLAALARGDAGMQQKALESLTRLSPADGKTFGDLADLEVAERKFPEAVRDYEAMSRLDPEESEVWNQLGYARAYAGDFGGAHAALEHYESLLPRENINALDSLGEVSFYAGDFKSAEKYFLEADRKNREEFGGADLLKAAQARLLSGDLAGADRHFEQYAGFAERRGLGLGKYLEAQWAFLTGRRKAAMADLEKLIPSLAGDGRSLALSQLSVWKLETGDAKAAEQLADQARIAAVSPGAGNTAALCSSISTGRVPSGSRPVEAYALFFARKYAEAVPLLEEVYRETRPNVDGQIRTLLAWAYIKTNRAGDAARLIGTFPIPLSSGETLFASLIFPRYLFVRAAVLERQGKRTEAKSAYELFLKYAGDGPDIFGDAETARKNLSAL